MTTADTLGDLLRSAVSKNPSGLAVVDGQRSLSYQQLGRQVGRLARALAEVGVGRHDRVALHLDKTIDAVVAIHAVLAVGAAYVPIDPGSPSRRAAMITGDCQTKVGIFDARLVGRAPDLAPIQTALVVDAAAGPLDGIRVVDADAIARHDLGPVDPSGIGLDLAYILYTSGSTGVPKGVMLTHRNALSFVEWAVETFSICTDDRLSSHAPFHFDLSILDLFCACAAAAPVVLVPSREAMFPAAVRKFIDRQRITVWYSVPSILGMLAERAGLERGDLPTLRVILFAGEVFPTRSLQLLMHLVGQARYANLYGPTETNVCTFYEVLEPPSDIEATIPIGIPITGVETLAVDEHDQPVAPGEVGELIVRGPTVMSGYWADPEKSASRFLAYPPAVHLTDQCYRTGDLVRLDDDGNWRYLGRRDHQIKRRGYRIELGEIEAALHAHEAVSECAVVAVTDDDAETRIVAFVETDAVDEVTLGRHLAERIPRYMQPDAWHVGRALPRTSTGKVDRQQLLADARA